MRRGLRVAAPTPREGVEAGLIVIELVAMLALGEDPLTGLADRRTIERT